MAISDENEKEKDSHSSKGVRPKTSRRKPPSNVMRSSTAEGPSTEVHTLESEIKVEPMDLGCRDEPPPIRANNTNANVTQLCPHLSRVR